MPPQEAPEADYGIVVAHVPHLFILPFPFPIPALVVVLVLLLFGSRPLSAKTAKKPCCSLLFAITFLGHTDHNGFLRLDLTDLPGNPVCTWLLQLRHFR